MEDDGVLRSMQRQTNIGAGVLFLGWLVIALAAPLGWNRQTVTVPNPGAVCEMNGKPVDCQAVGFPAGVLPAPITQTEFNPAPYGFGLLIMIGGICVLAAASGNWNVLKQDMVDYAYRRAEHEGTAPNLNFMHFFESRYRGATEWEILRRAYAEMESWSPEPVKRYGPIDRPYQMVVEESPERRCGGCGAVADPKDRFCSRCGGVLSD